MFATVKILVKGHASSKSNCPTITLIKDGAKNIIVDPGTADKNLITKRLRAENLSANDINIVCLTHSHIDHYYNLGMFGKAKILEYYGLWSNNGKVKKWKKNFTKNIKIINTPGHNYDGLTLMVKTKDGMVAICGDVFWQQNKPANDPYASDKIKLTNSRKLILTAADYIIPGHGDIYKTR